MNTNISSSHPEETLSQVFRALSTPARVRLLLAIGRSEACVCHLEALLDLRQAYISQQLMELREAGLLETRRSGRYIYYRLRAPELLDPVLQIAGILGIPEAEITALVTAAPLTQCCCPNCVETRNPKP